MKRCMYCGHENEDSLVTCAVCGNRLGDPVPTQDPMIMDEPENDAAQPDTEEQGQADSFGTGRMPEMTTGAAGMDRGPEADAVPMDRPADAAVDDLRAGQASETPMDEARIGQASEVPADDARMNQAPEVPMDEARMGQTSESLMDGTAAMGGFAGAAENASDAAGMAGAPGQYPPNAGQTPGMAQDDVRVADEAMVTQEPAFAGQIPVNSQFGETTPAGQFPGGANAYTPDRTPGYGEDWRQDVGRGQTYGARTQYEARREARRPQGVPREGVAGGTYGANGQYGAQQRDQYGSAGYGYRQPQGMDSQPQGGRQDYGRRESAGGSKMFMVRARKRVKSVSFFLMALTFTAMFALNVYNIYCGNALRNLTESDVMLANILSGAGTNFFTQMLTELASQLVKMVVNVQDIVAQLGKTVELIIAVVFLVPNVLYCLALWLMFFRTDTKRRQFPMGGYTLARVMMVLKFLIACLVLAIGLVISVYFVVVGAQRKSGSIDSSLIQGVILLIVMIVLAVFVVMYYIQWMFCLKVVRDNAKKGTDPGRMPGFVVVLSVLCTGACVALMIPMAPNDYIGLAARGAAAAYFLISGLWVLIYKIRVKRS